MGRSPKERIEGCGAILFWIFALIFILLSIAAIIDNGM